MHMEKQVAKKHDLDKRLEKQGVRMDKLANYLDIQYNNIIGFARCSQSLVDSHVSIGSSR